MSKADKMFDDLGYVDRFRENTFTMEHDVEYCIDFRESDKSVLFLFDGNLRIDYEILLAVNEKMKELGWLDE